MRCRTTADFLLSGYANWFYRRHNRGGHLFQGRFKGELIEDESYFWNVSRYVHLNPVRGRRPLVERLEQWPWSSYPGYWRQRNQVDWVAYDAVYQAAFAQPRSALVARDIAAWLARRLTTATLRELAAPFGLTHPDSVANFTRRAERAMQQRPRLRRQVESLRKTLLGAHHTT